MLIETIAPIKKSSPEINLLLFLLESASQIKK